MNKWELDGLMSRPHATSTIFTYFNTFKNLIRNIFATKKSTVCQKIIFLWGDFGFKFLKILYTQFIIFFCIKGLYQLIMF